jgi:CRP/FNR family cyclic AMP-dependent transcriptional regulator
MTPARSCLAVESLLKRIPFFACLSDDELAELRETVQIKRFGQNEVILLEEQTAQFMYLVYSGKVKAVQISEGGRENILAIHEEGDYFGEMGLLDGKTSPATVIAMVPAVIGLIRKADFDRYISEHREVQKAIIALLCSRLREAWSMLKIMTSADAEQRIRAMLAHIGAHFGEAGREGTLIRMRLTHQDIAHYASVSRETVTRLLDKLKKSGEIEIPSRWSILLKPGFFEKTRIL